MSLIKQAYRKGSFDWGLHLRILIR
jgi:hypothetical protein